MIDRESLVLCSYYLDNPALRRFHAIIRPEHFQEPGTSMLFTVLQRYHQEYGRMPTHQEAEMEVRDYRGPKQHEEDSALALLGRYEAERAVAAPEPRWLERQASRFIDEAETTAIVLGFIAQLEKSKEDDKDDDETASEQLLRHVSRVNDVRELLTQRPLAGLHSARRNTFGTSSTAHNSVSAPAYRRLTS
jgi:hypothetical protein